MIEHPTRRGHRIVGPLRPSHRAERHWVIAVVGIAVTVAAAATSAYASYESAQQQAAAQKATGKYNAQLAENQAQQARNEALNAKYAAEVQAKQREDHTRRVLASQRVAAGASGITTEGSPLAVMMDQASQGAYEAALIRYGGETQQAGYLNQGNVFDTQGAFARFSSDFSASAAEEAGAYRAGTTLLSGVGSAASQYATYARSQPSSTRGG